MTTIIQPEKKNKERGKKRENFPQLSSHSKIRFFIFFALENAVLFCVVR